LWVTAPLDKQITIEGTALQLAEHIRVGLPGVGGRKEIERGGGGDEFHRRGGVSRSVCQVGQEGLVVAQAMHIEADCCCRKAQMFKFYRETLRHSGDCIVANRQK
jgi:hypothetical protein